MTNFTRHPINISAIVKHYTVKEKAIDFSLKKKINMYANKNGNTENKSSKVF